MTVTESALVALVESEYNVTVVSDKPLVPQLGLDSLELAELVLLIEDHWIFMDEKIPMDENMMERATVQSISALIDAEKAA